LLNRYKCMQMDTQTKLIALLGEKTEIDRYLEKHVGTSRPDSEVTLIGFEPGDRALLEQHQQAMKINDIHIL